MEKGLSGRSLCRIAVTGPESTGKSALCGQLAKQYGTTFVPEYSRTYLSKLGREYEYGDILQIAKGQLELEETTAANTAGFLFCDTEFIVTRIWSIFKYNRCDPWIDRQISDHRYDLYLLCDIDLPWEYDSLREHPHQRQELFNMYLSELQFRQLPYEVISGHGTARLHHAEEAIYRRFGLLPSSLTLSPD